MSGSETDIQWFIARDGKQHGPVSDVELRKLVELAHLKPTDLVWRQGFTDWRAAASVFPAIAQPPAPAPAPVNVAPAPSPAPVTAPAPASPAPASASPQTASRFGSPLPGPQPARDSWRPPAEPRPNPLETRPLGAAPRATPFPSAQIPGAPIPGTMGPGPGPGPRITTDSRKPSELAAERAEMPRQKSSGKRRALVAVGLLAMAGAGAWAGNQYKEQLFALLQPPAGAPGNTAAKATAIPPSAKDQASPKGFETAAAAPAPNPGEVDRKLQSRHVWVSIKQEFPDWYQARVAEVARLGAEQKTESDITRYLVEQIVALRRENAKQALAASTARHKELAAAFLANLKQLSTEGGEGCYEFISKGETSPAIVAKMQDPKKSVEIETQVMAIVAAIAEGRKAPSEHAAPVKTDYDILAGELGRLGWTQADMQLFANPKELAKAPRERVCNMLKDWFTAHLAIQDPGTQERLLFETLKPVVAG